MKKTSFIFVLLLLTGISAYSQHEYSRILSYSQWFDEMIACRDSTYVLTDALIRPELKTDTTIRDAIPVTANVLLSKVEFEGFSEADMLYLPNWFDNTLEVRNFTFQGQIALKNCSGAIPGFINGQFMGDLELSHIKSPQPLMIFDAIECSGNVNFSDIDAHKFGIYNSIVRGSLVLKRFVNFNEVILQQDSIYGPALIHEMKGRGIRIERSQFEIRHPDPENAQSPFTVAGCEMDVLRFRYNTINQTASDQWVSISMNKASDYIEMTQSNIHPFTAISGLQLNDGRLALGAVNWVEGVGFHNVTYNEFSYFDWSSLKGKISTFNAVWQNDGRTTNVVAYNGRTYKELENRFKYDRLLFARKGILNHYIEHGYREYANELMIEIRDLETRMWRHKYIKDPTLESYFHWKMNVFLKRFSEYGTNPVIAIIYSLKVILIFAVFYLFFHNDWDIGSRKKIGQRLHMMLRYFQVNKGLSELEEESQSELHAELSRLSSVNEASVGRVPSFFTKALRWYIRSNQLSDGLRKKALQRLDILSGTYSELPQGRKRYVALMSALWFFGFLLYTVLLKTLNALTLSLNAFTTLGFGNIPTKGFSRYIVIVQGFIGWVLMTIFSVTLISQLIQ